MKHGSYGKSGNKSGGGSGSSRPNMGAMHKHRSEKIVDQTKEAGTGKSPPKMGGAGGPTTKRLGKLGPVNQQKGEEYADKNLAAAKM